MERPWTASGTRKRYRQFIARSALRVAAELVMFETPRSYRSFALNGHVAGIDPATGLPRRVWLFPGTTSGTTSGFGPDSRAFAADKPLTLVTGDQLVDMLQEHGLAAV